MKKLFLSLGTISTATLPIIAVVSCSSDEPFNKTYDSNSKKLSYTVEASTGKFNSNIVLPYNVVSNLANTISQDIKDHPETKIIRINYNVSADSTRSKTVEVTPGDLYNMFNTSGSTLIDGHGNGLPNIEFAELLPLINGSFSEFISGVNTTKLISLINASSYLTQIISFYSTTPGDSQAATEFRRTVSEIKDRTTMVSYFVVWQSFKENGVS